MELFHIGLDGKVSKYHQILRICQLKLPRRVVTKDKHWQIITRVAIIEVDYGKCTGVQRLRIFVYILYLGLSGIL